MSVTRSRSRRAGSCVPGQREDRRIARGDQRTGFLSGVAHHHRDGRGLLWRVGPERMDWQRNVVDHRAPIDARSVDRGIARRKTGEQLLRRRLRQDELAQGSDARRPPARGCWRARGPCAVTCWPLIVQARWKRPFAAGIAIRQAILPPPPDWPNTRHAIGIAAERRDVVPHPVQRQHKIEQARIAADGIALLAYKMRKDRDDRTR